MIGRRSGQGLAGARTVLPDGLRGLVGPGARVRDLGDRPGLGAARADRGEPLPARAPAPIARATGLGAASSSCSYAAIAIAKSLFQKGASAATALAFQFASTNLVWELGLVLWVLLGWQFTLAEYIGGIVMIVLMAVLLRAFVSPRLEERRQRPRPGRPTPAISTTRPASGCSWRRRLTSRASLVRRRPQLPRRLADALEGDRDRLPAGGLHRPARRTTSSTASSSRTRRRRSSRSRT